MLKNSPHGGCKSLCRVIKGLLLLFCLYSVSSASSSFKIVLVRVIVSLIMADLR